MLPPNIQTAIPPSLTHPAPPGRHDGFLCAAAFVLAILILHPVVDSSFTDELFYAKSALTRATTGRIAFYGTSPMIGWQILWGALAIKLFGFSFNVVRSSMLPFAFASVGLFHACLRRFGIARRPAVLGTLTLAFSPLFIPLASSFMTDAGALFGVLLCLYLCLRAISVSTPRHTILWLTLATATNLLLGTDRQIVWLGALVMVPSTAWLLRRRTGVLPAAALLWIVSFPLILTAVRWFSHQLGVQPAKVTGPLHLHAVISMLLQFLVRAPLCLTLVILPVAILGVAHVRALSRAAMVRTALVSLLAVLAIPFFIARGLLQQEILPWLYPFVGNLSIAPRNDELSGLREATLSLSLRTLLSIVLVAVLWILVEHLSLAFRRSIAPYSADWRPVLYTLGPFSAVYIVLLLPTELFGTGLFDRYLLFLLPLAIVALLKLFTHRDALPVPRLAYITLILTGSYVVLATHDWYAFLRARLTLVDHIRATGVPRTAILGGWEDDGWIQLQTQGFLNYRDMVRPPGQTYTTPPERKRPCERGMTDWIPAIDPRYAIVYSPIPCFAPSPFPPPAYRTWLPPFTRHLSVQTIPGYEPSSP